MGNPKTNVGTSAVENGVNVSLSTKTDHTFAPKNGMTLRWLYSHFPWLNRFQNPQKEGENNEKGNR